MRFLYSLILSFTSFSITAQQWVIDEIADEQKTSESIPVWLIVLLLIIGYFVYKHIQKKDDEATERHAKEQRMEEKQRLEEELREYREQHEDDIDISQFDDDIIVPSCPIHVDHPAIVESSSANSEEQLSNIETDKYILSPNGKEFIKAKNCESLIIPDSVEIVKAFACCGNIKNITIPHSVKVIEDFAFSGCSVNKIVIPNSVEKFGACIFSGCESLVEVVFEEGVKTFGESMFERCMWLKTIILPESLLSIPNSAFDSCLSIETIKLPPNLRRIGDSAFCSCRELREIIIPSAINDIGSWAFRDCGISSIVVPDSIYGISEYAFAENLNLKKVILPNTITCIMSHAFYECEHLHVRIPPSVTYIAPDAFTQCNDYCYENLHIEVPKGKKETLEKICELLKGKVTEYEVTEDMILPSDIATKKQRFIDFQIFKEKENLRNSEPMFYNGAQVEFRYTNNCTYDNFE